MIKIAIIPGSIRPNRVSPQIASWAQEIASKRDDAQFTLVDIAEYNLPLFDEPYPPAAGQEPIHEHTKIWRETIGSFDGFLFVTPEYNHTIPAPLKNAIDYVYAEWNNKACAFIGFGSAGGVRSIEHLRSIAAFLQLTDIASELNFKLTDDFDSEGKFAPRPAAEGLLTRQLDQLVMWTEINKKLRS